MNNNLNLWWCLCGARGIHYLRDDRVEGEDPLAHFGPHAEPTRGVPTVSATRQLLVNSSHDSETGEVAAFEELVGSHGGGVARNASRLFCTPRPGTSVPKPSWGLSASITCSRHRYERLNISR